MNIKYFVIVGSPHSGTCLLGSLLGAHSKVAVLNESYGRDAFKVIGKEVVGVKYISWGFRRHSRSSWWSHLINRLVNIGHWDNYIYRPFNFSKLCLDDWLNKKAKVVFISRKLWPTVKSLMEREGLPDRQAQSIVLDYRNRFWRDSQLCAFRLTLEELTRDPETSLRDLCTYLDLGYEPGMLKGLKYQRYYPEYSHICPK